MGTAASIDIRIGYMQFCPVFGDVDSNLHRIVAELERIEADIVVLPELAFTGYGFSSRKELLGLAENLEDSAALEVLLELCLRKNMNVVTGFAEMSGDCCYNSSVLLSPGGISGLYRKLHLFDREKLYFDPGDIPPGVFRVGEVRVGMMVCFDWLFPEMARTLALRGADIICHPANLVLDLCQSAMLTRCTENMVYAITANRTGSEERPFGTLEFTGGSQVVAPGGSLLHRGPVEEDEVFITSIDASRSRDKCLTGRNHAMDDRRPEFYRW